MQDRHQSLNKFTLSANCKVKRRHLDYLYKLLSASNTFVCGTLSKLVGVDKCPSCFLFNTQNIPFSNFCIFLPYPGGPARCMVHQESAEVRAGRRQRVPGEQVEEGDNKEGA